MSDLYHRKMAAIADHLEGVATRPEALAIILSPVGLLYVAPPWRGQEPRTVRSISVLASHVTEVSEHEDGLGGWDDVAGGYYGRNRPKAGGQEADPLLARCERRLRWFAFHCERKTPRGAVGPHLQRVPPSLM